MGGVVADHLGRVGLAVATSVTRMAVAPSMTWLLVSTSPLGVSTMPVPADSAPWPPSVDDYVDHGRVGHLHD